MITDRNLIRSWLTGDTGLRYVSSGVLSAAEYYLFSDEDGKPVARLVPGFNLLLVRLDIAPHLRHHLSREAEALDYQIINVPEMIKHAVNMEYLCGNYRKLLQAYYAAGVAASLDERLDYLKSCLAPAVRYAEAFDRKLPHDIDPARDAAAIHNGDLIQEIPGCSLTTN